MGPYDPPVTEPPPHQPDQRGAAPQRAFELPTAPQDDDGPPEGGPESREARRRPGRPARPPSERVPAGRWPGQRWGRGSLPGATAEAVQTWARAGGEPARRGREGRRSARRCGCSTTWVGGAGREGGSGRAASPRVANSSAVSKAPRMNSRSERRAGKSVVVEGNMCSESYGGGRTERVFPGRVAGPTPGPIPRGCAESTG